ncbi:hypothetical protein L289_2223 [Acinetobacter gerneri DSM 14967 = CIP 107464 = MTCC 9824]|nr:hypothetical protein L289_2223 [Acinetobacter gerneri DSM 14967 = CIP 107464 = MTCC 9824]
MLEKFDDLYKSNHLTMLNLIKAVKNLKTKTYPKDQNKKPSI